MRRTYNNYYSDEEEDYSGVNQKEELENSLYAIKDVLKQLSDAKIDTENPRGNPQNFRGGPGSRGAYSGGGGRGYQDGRERGGFHQRVRGGWGPYSPSPRGRPLYPPPPRGRFMHPPPPRGRFLHPPPPRGRPFGHSPPFQLGIQSEYDGDMPPVQRNLNSYGEQSPNSNHLHNKQQYRYDSQENKRPFKQVYGIRPQFLAETMANYPDCSCSLLQLLEEWNMQPSLVRDIACKYPNIFVFKGELIELRPEIGICSAHYGSEGCQNPVSCSGLHICDRYVMDRCYEKSCLLGHKWRTGHNDPILRHLLIDRLPFPTLRRLVQLTGDQGSTPSGPLDVCREYNSEEGCKQRNCSSLHLCLNFVIGLTRCKISNCELNHHLLSPQCCKLFEIHDIPTNEAPRDILVALLTSNPQLNTTEEEPKFSQRKKSKDSLRDVKNKKKHAEPEMENSENYSKKSSKNSSKQRTERENDSSSSESDSLSSDKDSSDHEFVEKKSKMSKSRVEKGKSPEVVEKETKKFKLKLGKEKSPEQSQFVENLTKVKPETRRTLWSHYLQGDVPVPEICYYSVENTCKDEGNSCQRLHATNHFHWQVIGQGDRWFNLRPDQVFCLEYAYCDPAKSSVVLPRLDPATLDSSVSGLFIVMGRETWEADFKAMVLSNSSNTKSMKIRRLCTEVIDRQEVKPAKYMWYFQDKNDTWVSYGNVDTAGASHLVSNITSDNIEKQYLQDSTSSLPFKNSRYSYLLDFKTMTQMNLNSRMMRAVIRRPVPHLQEKRKEEEMEKASIDLPQTWERMQPEERMRLVSVAPSSSEYQNLIGLLRGKLSSNKIMKIQRIQNPYLWRAFQNKVREMTATYKSESQVNIRQLFHGTPSHIVNNICSENFDWRLHGSKSGQNFGRGSYFAVEVDYSYNYADPDNNGLRYMFVVRVAVGSTTRGNSQMVRPPVNSATSMPFDSTVNSVSNPTIIVKYDKQEYYPEYLLTID